MLYFLHNRIEKTFAFTADSVSFAFSSWITARHFYLGSLHKYCFILGWLAWRFWCDIIFWKYPHKKV